MATNSMNSGPTSRLLSMRCVLVKILHVPVGKGRQKGLRVSNFALLLVVFKRRQGSVGVKYGSNICTD